MTKPNTPEYGNEVACSNCGDEWSLQYTAGLCQECSAEKQTHDGNGKP